MLKKVRSKSRKEEVRKENWFPGCLLLTDALIIAIYRKRLNKRTSWEEVNALLNKKNNEKILRWIWTREHREKKVRSNLDLGGIVFGNTSELCALCFRILKKNITFEIYYRYLALLLLIFFNIFHHKFFYLRLVDIFVFTLIYLWDWSLKYLCIILHWNETLI